MAGDDKVFEMLVQLAGNYERLTEQLEQVKEEVGGLVNALYRGNAKDSLMTRVSRMEDCQVRIETKVERLSDLSHPPEISNPGIAPVPTPTPTPVPNVSTKSSLLTKEMITAIAAAIIAAATAITQIVVSQTKDNASKVTIEAPLKALPPPNP